MRINPTLRVSLVLSLFLSVSGLLVSGCGVQQEESHSIKFALVTKQLDNGNVVLTSSRGRRYLLTLGLPTTTLNGLSNAVQGNAAFNFYNGAVPTHGYQCQLWPDSGVDYIPSTVPAINGYVSSCHELLRVKPISIPVSRRHGKKLESLKKTNHLGARRKQKAPSNKKTSSFKRGTPQS
jgi:hypothetical protein